MLKVAVVIIALIAVTMLVWIVVLKPFPTVTDLVARQEGYQYDVDVSLNNNGGDGWVKVYAQIESDAQLEVKDTRLFMSRGETNSLTFTFTLEFGSSVEKISYKAWAQTD